MPILFLALSIALGIILSLLALFIIIFVAKNFKEPEFWKLLLRLVIILVFVGLVAMVLFPIIFR